MGTCYIKQSEMLQVMGRLLLLITFAFIVFSCDDSSSPDQTLIGQSGSMARFALTPTHLYSIDDESLNVFQIMQNGALEKVNALAFGPGVETIFIRGESLYIGTNSAMVAYNISNPANPEYVFHYSHFAACDPVVVQDTLAYITIRTANCKGSDANTLDILNIKNPAAPVLIGSYALESPYGLGIDNNLLFVCEGENGLKIFNAANPFNLVMLKTYRDVNAYDVIPNEGILIVTGSDGVVQYNYSDQNNIQKLSTISKLK